MCLCELRLHDTSATALAHTPFVLYTDWVITVLDCTYIKFDTVILQDQGSSVRCLCYQSARCQLEQACIAFWQESTKSLQQQISSQQGVIPSIPLPSTDRKAWLQCQGFVCQKHKSTPSRVIIGASVSKDSLQPTRTSTAVRGFDWNASMMYEHVQSDQQSNPAEAIVQQSKHKNQKLSMQTKTIAHVPALEHAGL